MNLKLLFSVMDTLKKGVAIYDLKTGELIGQNEAFQNASHSNLITQEHTLDDETKVRVCIADIVSENNILESILSAIPHSVFWKDRDSRYLGCNRRFALDAGLSMPADLIGKTDYEMPWTKEESDFFVYCDKKIMDSGVPDLNFEETQKNSAGEDTTVLTSKVPLKKNNGEVYGILGIYVNITDFKVAQKKIKEQEQMLVNASQLSSLGEMSGGIAHEINNPLAIIKANLKYMTRLCQQEPFNKEAATSMLVELNETVDRIAKIIVGLRNISRTPKEENDPCNFSEILQDVLSIAKEKFRNNGVNLNEDLPPELMKKKFVANRIQLSQVLVNLLNNAYDAIIEENLPEKWVNLSLKETTSSIIFTITDCGNGIPQHVREKMFNPFYTTKGIGKGTGIGLSISKAMIEKNNGKLFYDTEVAHTTFVIELPLK